MCGISNGINDDIKREPYDSLFIFTSKKIFAAYCMS